MRYIMLWVPGRSCVQLQHGQQDGPATEQQQNFPTLTETACCLPYLQVTFNTAATPGSNDIVQFTWYAAM